MDNREKGYTVDELLAEMEPQYRVYRDTIRDCIAGLTGHAARLAARGEEGQLPTLRRMIGDMSDFWGLAEDTAPKACQAVREQYEAAFDQAVSAARDSGSAPELSEQARADILAGLELHAQEMSATGDMEEWIDECDTLAAQLRTEWEIETSPPQQAASGMEMSKDAFWELIAEAKKECGQDMDASLQWLKEQLIARGPQQAQDFHDILHGYQELSNKYGLWTAASLMCEGCSDDGFIDFRAWLIAQGKEAYMAALADPDSLADVEPYGGCQFELLTYVGSYALEAMTGQSAYDGTVETVYDALVEELRQDITYGEGIGYPYEWDEVKDYFPRLCERYLEPGTVEFMLEWHETKWFLDNPDIQKAREGGPPQRNIPQNDATMGGIILG